MKEGARAKKRGHPEFNEVKATTMDYLDALFTPQEEAEGAEQPPGDGKAGIRFDGFGMKHASSLLKNGK